MRGENGTTRGKTFQSRVVNPQNLIHIWHWVQELSCDHIGGRQVLSPMHHATLLMISILYVFFFFQPLQMVTNQTLCWLAQHPCQIMIKEIHQRWTPHVTCQRSPNMPSTFSIFPFPLRTSQHMKTTSVSFCCMELAKLEVRQWWQLKKLQRRYAQC